MDDKATTYLRDISGSDARRCASALRTLAESKDGTLGALIIQRGLAGACVAALCTHVASADVQELASTALRLCGPLAPAALSSAMRARPTDAGAQARLCRTLADILEGDEAQEGDKEAVRVTISETGTVEAVIAALRAHSGDGPLVAAACDALRCAGYAPANREAVVAGGAVPELVRVLFAAGEEESESPRMALAVLSASDYGCELVTQGIVEAMRGRVSDTAVQENGCRTLLAVCSWAETCACVERNGGLQALVTAMKAHPANLEVQEAACQAFAQAMSEGVALPEGVEVALKAAVEAHPDSWYVQAHAQQVLAASDPEKHASLLEKREQECMQALRERKKKGPEEEHKEAQQEQTGQGSWWRAGAAAAAAAVAVGIAGISIARK